MVKRRVCLFFFERWGDFFCHIDCFFVFWVKRWEVSLLETIHLLVAQEEQEEPKRPGGSCGSAVKRISSVF